MADEGLRKQVAEAICKAVCGTDLVPRLWGCWLKEADAAIAAVEAHRGEQRLKAHEMTFDPRWSLEMFGRDRGDEDEGAG